MIFNLVDPKELVGVDDCSHDLDRAELSSLLVENMFHYNGVGLSANQIGIQERAFAMISDMETQQTTVCFNPRIIKYYKDTDLMEEGCLSYPDLLLPIPRHSRIVVKYEDENKKILKRKLEGFIARIFQHEYDHMEGIDFTQRQL
jgi:peptide deformylase